MKLGNKQVIGRSDKADFPSWNITRLPVKVDSGAYRSSIDCSFTEVFQKNKVRILRYVLLLTLIKIYENCNTVKK